jgi:hypothetical protein
MARGCRVWRLYILKGEKPADLLVRTPVKSTCGSQACQSTRRRGAGHAARRRRQGDRMRLPMAAFGTSRQIQSPEFTVGIDAKLTFVDKRSRPSLQRMTHSGHRAIWSFIKSRTAGRRTVKD